MPLSTSYLLPAILLNPALILHLINTLISLMVSPSESFISHSPHPFMESLGPVPGTALCWDVHADDAFCWRYTAVMVLVQVLAFGRVSENRVQRRARRAAKRENGQSPGEHDDCDREAVDGKFNALFMNDALDGAGDVMDESSNYHLGLNGHEAANSKAKLIGGARTTNDFSKNSVQSKGSEVESEASLTETSEEEMMMI